MKMIIVALALVAVAAAAVLPEEPIPILRSSNDQQPDGSYVWNFETGNGIVREEVGEKKEVIGEDNKPSSVIVVRGSYSYPLPDGAVDTINYFADETGYHAEGPSVPKAQSRR